MAEIVLFHHVQGLTDGVRAFAERLRAAGHVVHTPDLFEGRTFDSIEDGLAHVRGEVGFEAVVERGAKACEGLPEGLVFAGMSLGVMPAQYLLQRTSSARGAVLLHGFVEPAELGGAWPAGVPAQVHGMERDPFFVDEGDLAAARRVQAEHPEVEIHTYPGAGHLFTDSGSPDYDEAATAAVLERVEAMLAHPRAGS